MNLLIPSYYGTLVKEMSGNSCGTSAEPSEFFKKGKDLSLIQSKADHEMIADIVIYHICNEMQWSIFKKVAPVLTSQTERDRLQWISDFIHLVIHGIKESR